MKTTKAKHYKSDEVIEEFAIGDDHFLHRWGHDLVALFDFCRACFEHVFHIGKINITEQKPKWWHDDLCHKGFYYRGKCSTEDKSYGHIYEVALEGKFFEFF